MLYFSPPCSKEHGSCIVPHSDRAKQRKCPIMDLKDSEERSDREREKGRGRQRGARWSESVKERPKRCCYEEAQPLLVRRVSFFFFSDLSALRLRSWLHQSAELYKGWRTYGAGFAEKATRRKASTTKCMWIPCEFPKGEISMFSFASCLLNLVHCSSIHTYAEEFRLKQ